MKAPFVAPATVIPGAVGSFLLTRGGLLLPHTPVEYRKTATVFAVQMDCAFAVKTPQGVMTEAAGGWLLEGITGSHWPISDSTFTMTHETVR